MWLCGRAVGYGALPSDGSGKKKQPWMSWVGVFVMAFSSIAGGPYGIEPAVGAIGAAPTLAALCESVTQPHPGTFSRLTPPPLPLLLPCLAQAWPPCAGR